ncbi:hypothetical protein PYW07_001096 [Mythimna separata]|uniref:Uncharacterized protein n=1 Tax=Mythimna separata TaxID=271217 RepID=A0AAD8DVL1_MYTSE|nr:hypothetical protein PYW07_001096 [Mythimna separata]
MGLKAVNVFLLIALSACLVQTAFGKPGPRDSSVAEDQSVVPINNEDLSQKEDVTRKSEPSTPAEYKIPGRVSCDFEEANEDAVCQEHCLPKGYTYGICVSHTCSCI